MTFAVYIFWSGTLPLYVGQTNDLRRRMREHARDRYGSHNVTHISITRCETRWEALGVESHYIGKLRPAGNVLRNPRRQRIVDYYLDDPRPLTAHDRKVESLRLLRAAA